MIIPNGRLEKRVKNVIYYHQYLWDSPSYLDRIDHKIITKREETK